MLGLIALICICSVPETVLQEVSNLYSDTRPNAIVRKPTAQYIILPEVTGPSKFIGVDSKYKVRFDLVTTGLVARNLSSGKTLWSTKCHDAVLHSNQLVCLRENMLTTYSIGGRRLARKRLKQSAVTWDYLDPNLRYALGFKARPNTGDAWTLFVLDLKTMRSTPTAISYDLGGHVNPTIISTAKACVVYDLFYTKCFAKNSIRDPQWTRSLGNGYVGSHSQVSDDLRLLWKMVDTSASVVIDVSSGNQIVRSTLPLEDFVLGTGAHTQIWTYEDKRVRIFELSSKERNGSAGSVGLGFFRPGNTGSRSTGLRRVDK